MKKLLLSLFILMTVANSFAQSNEIIISKKKAKDDAQVILSKDGKTPIYIVDGKTVSSIKEIAPDDIASVDVLKGALAKEKYGEKGANGVIVITTKKKAKNDSTKVTITIDGDKSSEIKNDVNMTVVVDGNKVTINGKEVDENDPRLSIEGNSNMPGKRNQRIILKKLDKNLNGLENNESKKPRILVEGKPLGKLMPLDKIEDEIIINKDGAEEEDDFDMIVPNNTKSNPAFLGVVTEETEAGAKINQVSEESPAEKAGLMNDDIITKVNDTKIDGPSTLYDAIGKCKPEEKVTIHYIRKGKSNSVVATLAKNKNTMQYYNFSSPNGQNGPSFNFTPKQYFDPNTGKLQPNQREGFRFAIPNFPGMGDMHIEGFENKPKLGISIEDIENGDGVKITNVTENSPAAKSGLVENDIIVQVNDQKIKDVDALKPIIKDAKEGSTFSFQIKRNKELKTIQIKLPKKLKTADL